MRVSSAAFVRLAVAVLGAAGGAAAASEGGSTNYAIGAQTVAAAYLPPPGATEFYAYVANVHSGRFRDDAGRTAIPQFDAEVVAAAPRVMHTFTRWQGIDISAGAFAEAVYVRVKAGEQSDRSLGVDLLGLEPFGFSGGSGDWHWLLSSALYIPVGEYHRDALANSTTHYAGAALQAGVTWMPTPRWDLSAVTHIVVNQRNKATGYRSGAIFGTTWGANWRPWAADPRWQIGLNGYVERQVGDDHLDGQPVPGGFRLQKQAIGPQFAFWPGPATVWLLKWQHEFDVRNGPQGDLVWLEFALPI